MKIKATVFKKKESQKDLRLTFDITKEGSEGKQKNEPNAVSPIETILNDMGHIEKGITGQIQNNAIAQSVVFSQI